MITIDPVSETKVIPARITLHVQGGIVYCNQAKLDLRRRPKMLRLYRLFIEAPRQIAGREEIAAELYGLSSQHSARYQQSIYNNLVKVISRARIDAMSHLSWGCGPGIRWFVYDYMEQNWLLCGRMTRN